MYVAIRISSVYRVRMDLYGSKFSIQVYIIYLRRHRAIPRSSLLRPNYMVFMTHS